jgi:hypothetical protein
MLFMPLKLTWTQSGYAWCVASSQPPPLPQLAPARLPSIVAEAGAPGPYVLDAEATAPALESATFEGLVCAAAGRLAEATASQRRA